MARAAQRCPACGMKQERRRFCRDCGEPLSEPNEERRASHGGSYGRSGPARREPDEGQVYRDSRPGDAALEPLADVVENAPLFMKQYYKHWWEILFDWEQANEYTLTAGNRPAGVVLESGGGFLRALARVMLGSHRPFDVEVFNNRSQLALTLSRKFFFFFSDMTVTGGDGRIIGRVQRRFSIIYKQFSLYDASGRLFAEIKSPFWRLWAFPIVDVEGREVGRISKKWSGLFKEMFTDADNFLIDFGNRDWTLEQRGVILAAAVAIDFDFFENNHKS